MGKWERRLWGGALTTLALHWGHPEALGADVPGEYAPKLMPPIATIVASGGVETYYPGGDHIPFASGWVGEVVSIFSNEPRTCVRVTISTRPYSR